MKRYGGDFWSGLALGALGAYIVLEASRWEYLGPDGPGPGFFPLWYGIAMAGLSLWLMVSSVLRAETDAIDWSGAWRAFATWLALAAAVAALKLVGFVVGFAALAFFVVAVMYRRPLGNAAIVAACITAGFYLVFPLALGVKLP
ncbi:MAG TPA: tripartite tricarboxylate transporter TctB family protein [Burkholderiales bacterium]|nr:tripartite tricarboxylate transporter TctB family protein [Burkholderiales bacterium]